MKTSVRLDVGPHLPDGDNNEIVADVHLPTATGPQTRLFLCIPGGGMCRRYFDLPGAPNTHFSFARAMTEAGHIVVTLDPVGVGESTRPENGFALTSVVEAELNHRAFVQLRQMEVGGIALGGMPAIGVGHSAGALLIVMQQAKFRDFDAVLLLCFGSDGLPQHLAPDYVESLGEADFDHAKIVDYARRAFGGNGYMPIVERPAATPAARALASAYSPTVAPVGVHAMTPGNVRTELGMIDKPVFLALGGRDMTGPAHRLGADYACCPDFTRYVIPDSGHHLFVVPAAKAMYRRIAAWAEGIAEGAGR